MDWLTEWWNSVVLWFLELKEDFIACFITEDRWLWLWKGLCVTLEITFAALAIGILVGVVVALIRVTHDNTYSTMRRGPLRFLLRLLNSICRLYLTVFRGTPMVVQLMIWYFVILVSMKNGLPVACIAFGINSGAYVAEIIRAGTMSIDKGQMEAGRSLGFNYVQTLRFVILPPAFKNVLPALCNECISLTKETAVAGYVALQDLTKAGDIIRSRTFIAFMPLLAVAAIYLGIVMLMSWAFSKLERRLRANDNH